jgi:PAS domain S-box-containing protein
MSALVRVLIVEDSEDDAMLVLRELDRRGYRTEHRIVDTAEALTQAIRGEHWDIVLADYTLPQFSGARALEMVRALDPDVPFIFVSGSIGEDAAVAAMKAGAQDYIIKGNLKRLVPAVERELRESAAHRDKVRAESERRTAEARFRQILALAGDAIVTLDDERRIAVFNGAAERLFGFAADEAIGQSIDLLVPERLLKAYGELFAKFVRSPAAAWNMSEIGDVIGRRKDGSEFPAEASMSKLAEDGRTVFTIIIRDISARRRAEETLRQLSRAVEQSANLVVVTDADARIQYVNRKVLQMTGYAEAEVIGQKPSLWKSGKTSDADYAALWSTILAGGDWRGEFENRAKDGSLFSVSAVISPIRDDAGHINHFVSIQEDITEKKELERQLQQAHRLEAVGQLSGGMAHDFNNVLTIIIGNVELAMTQANLTPDVRLNMEQALHAGLRGATLIRKLLAFARRQALRAAAFDLNRLVSEATDMLWRTLGEEIEVKVRLDDNLRAAFADPAQVESALVNLAINARDAMPDGGRLTIETENCVLDEDYCGQNLDVAPGEYVMLAVSDTGTGMTPEVLARVFEPFFTTKGESRGTGLGLSMIYGFARQSKGHVKIYSEVGHGTTVRLYLPVAEAAPARPVEDTAALEVAPGTATILVVEDNNEVRMVAVTILKGLGYRIVEADNGASAMAILRGGERIDLLYTDVIMPGGMSGVALAREARALRPDLPVLFTSGFAGAQIQEIAGPEKVEDFLIKPVRRQELAHKIREILLRNAG